MNYAKTLCDRKKTVILKTNDTPFVYEAQDNAAAKIVSTAEKKKNSKVLEKLEKDVATLHNNKSNKVENKNEWKRMWTKKWTHKSNKKHVELEKWAC